MISVSSDLYLFYAERLKFWLLHLGLNDMSADTIKMSIIFGCIVIVALITNFIAKKIILSIIYHFAKKSATIWDDILIEKKVFHKLAHLAPALVIYYSVTLPLSGYPGLLLFIQKSTLIYIVVMMLMTLMAFVDSLHEIYKTLSMSKTRSIKGYLQVIKIILYFMAIIFISHILFDIDLGKFFTGLGAMAAVLMFIFKDSILGLVASIQLSANDMLRPGDWIEMPSRKADGEVQDINLTTVKVQNWDKTVTTIPTYALVSDSFTNWRGMQEAEGRRIKKSINIDMKSVEFYSDNMLKRISEDHIIAKNFDVNKFIGQNQENDSEHRTLTNLGLFRAYLESYIRNIPVIHPEMTLLVHYLQPLENGLPLEIIAFSREKQGVPYEKLQCEIYDHILAMLPLFELKVFQRPTGEDFRQQ